MEKPDFVTKEHLEFLNNLETSQISRITTPFQLVTEFPNLYNQQARLIFEYWRVAKSKGGDKEITKWRADEEFVYDQYNNIVCECHPLLWVDQEHGMAWAKRNASEIAFLHNVRLSLDNIISLTSPTSKEG